MKRASLFIVLALLASPVLATYTAQISDLPPAWSGGPFLVVLNGSDTEGTFTNYTFPSFCLEKGVLIGLPGTYIATIDEDVQSGAFGANNSAPFYTVLQTTTKQLYASYRSISTTPSQGQIYQNAIWASQSGAYFDPTLILPNITGDGVKVLNLWTQNTDGTLTDVQSQLFMVPAPGAILLGSLGMGLVGWLRQRRSL